MDSTNESSGMCTSCGMRPNRGLTWTGKLYFGKETTLYGLCVVCAVHGPERPTPSQVEAQDCGCSARGLCAYHAAASTLGAEDVKGWQHVAGGLWDFERKFKAEAQAAGIERVLVVDGAVAARVAGTELVRSVAWLPDGRAEVTYIDHEASQPAPATLVPVGLLTTDEAMRDVLVNRNTWSRWEWRSQAYASATVRNVCGTCRGTYSARRTSPHVCGETLDSRGRAKLDPETRLIRQRANAAMARIRMHRKRGWSLRPSDVEAVEAAGMTID